MPCARPCATVSVPATSWKTAAPWWAAPRWAVWWPNACSLWSVFPEWSGAALRGGSAFCFWGKGNVLVVRASKGKACLWSRQGLMAGRRGTRDGRWQETGLWPRQEEKRHEKGPGGSRRRRASVSQAHTARHAPGWGLRGKIRGNRPSGRPVGDGQQKAIMGPM